MNSSDPMSDNDVLQAVRESVSALPAAGRPSAEQIKRRGRAQQRRRLIPAAGALVTVGAAATAALAATPVAPASHQPTAGHQPQARLDAWTVSKQADGDIQVTIKQLSDPSGLQSTLRADGVPANVTALGHPDPSCRPYPMSPGLFTSVYTADKTAASGDTVLIIDPSALPSGAGVQIGASFGRDAAGPGLHQADANQAIHHAVHQPAHQVGAHNGALRAALVYASQQCTGS